ncbi:MAG TPA: NAD(P)H-binding protein [Ktedonobacteraceae bacterium]|jgi:NADH dehydrogenase
MILITGATGYFGRHLVRQLAGQGVRPRCLVRDPQRAAALFAGQQIEIVQGDTRQAETLVRAVSGVETIIHAAFLTADRKETPAASYTATNVAGTTNLVRAAQEAGVARFIEISGLGTRQDAPGSYMQGRYLAEQVVRESGPGWTIVQPSVLFGPDAPFLKGLCALIRASPVVPLPGGGQVLFQPIHVEDVVGVVVHLLATPRFGREQALPIGGPARLTLAQIVAALLRAMGRRRLLLPMPLSLVGVGATLMQAVLPRPPLTRAALTLFSFDNITDLDSVERLTGVAPRSFERFLCTGLSAVDRRASY